MRDPKTIDEKTNQKSFQTTSIIMLLLIIKKIYLYSFIFDLEIYLANQIVLYKKNHPWFEYKLPNFFRLILS